MSDNPHHSSTSMLAAHQRLQGRSNFPGWKKDFTLLAESKGYTGYYKGTIPKPTDDPTHDVTMTITDPSGGITITVVSTPIKSTSPSSERPLIHEWTVRNGGANITLKDVIVDPDQVGFKEEDTAHANWIRVLAQLGGVDSVEMLVAKENFSRQSAQFTFEHDNEYKDFIASFIALRKAATQSGVTISDAGAKNRLVSIVSDSEILRAAAFGLPTNATFADTNSKLASTHFFQWNQVRKQQAEASKIQAMVAQALSAQASSRSSSQSAKKKDGREKNLASDVCTNCFHGLMGGKGPGIPIQLDNTNRYISEYREDDDGDVYRRGRNVFSLPPSTSWTLDKDDGMSAWFSAIERTKTDLDTRYLGRNVLVSERPEVLISEIPIPTACILDIHVNSADNTRISAIKRTFTDSGATHMCWTSRDDFVQYSPITGHRGKAAKDRATFGIKGIGKIRFNTAVDGAIRIVEIPTMFMPELAHNLISLLAMAESGCHGSWNSQALTIEKGGKIILLGIARDCMFEVDIAQPVLAASARSQ
ncbi:hypothetical protein C8J56DRAFT_1065052 [Mycena floridula]|nr:hypothetical protein C8J56DRAFT_1065052 [Mycena floridula]